MLLLGSWRVCALLLALASLVIAATPTSFCKCACFGEYKIIPLDARSTSLQTSNPRSLSSLVLRADSNSDSSSDSDDSPEFHQKTCNDCNRVFCIEQNLPECKGATSQDVTATCFQRDSSKDEAVVFIFIFATVGLLGWAIIRPWADRWLEKARERREYIPVADGQR